MLHWFQDQRLVDPGAGREEGLTTRVVLATDLQVVVRMVRVLNVVMVLVSDPQVVVMLVVLVV